ncbi:MAG: O-antigen ligase family protein [Coriobacteriia bacterium]|nr:O-antigen ligase family protein [Coriobacteriia bacterium]
MGASAKKSRGRTARQSSSSPSGLPARLLIGGVLLGAPGVALAIAPGGYNPFGPVKAAVLLLACALAAAGLALDPDRTLGALERLRRRWVAWTGFALVFVAALATATSIDPAQSLIGHYPEYQGLLLLAASALIGFGAFVLADDERSWTLVGRAMTCAVLVVSIYALFQAAGLDPVAYQRELVVRRVLGTLGNASNLGVFLVMALPLIVSRVRTESGAWRVAGWAGLAGGVAALALSLSRGAWAGALAAAVVWLLVEGRTWSGGVRVRVAAAAAGVAALALVATVLLVPNAGSRIGELSDPSAGTPGWRIEVWGISTRLVADRPVLGAGPGSYRYAFPPYRTAATMAGETGSQVLEDPHNIFASAAVAAGVPGLLALLALAAGALLAALRLRDDAGWLFASPALAAAMAGGLVALQFHFFTLDSAPLLALLAGLAIGRAPGPALAPASAPVRARAVARGAAWAVAAVSAVLAVAATGLVFADREIASGYRLVEEGAPWPVARGSFAAATALAPWEPATEWALGRGATQAMSGAAGIGSLADAESAMASVMRRLPADPLAVAQAADVHLVAGVTARDVAQIRLALPLIERAIAMDPQNGYRWSAKGTALAALGQADAAIDAFRRAVQYAPNDRQAWIGLSRVYRSRGMDAEAVEAQGRADGLVSTGTTPAAP